jgi:hypothetical protein
VPKGWHACLLQGSCGPLWGALTAEPTASHTFGYFGLPQTYRLAIATGPGRPGSPLPLERHALQASLTVDWRRGRSPAPGLGRACALELLATLLPTLLIEGGVLLAFGYTLRRSWRPFLLANLATQTGLYLFLGLQLVRSGPGFGFYLFFIPAEAVITLAEALFYRRFLTEQSRRRATSLRPDRQPALRPGRMVSGPAGVGVDRHSLLTFRPISICKEGFPHGDRKALLLGPLFAGVHRPGAVLPGRRRDGYSVVLDRTAFYPEGGGQPCDTGAR